MDANILNSQIDRIRTSLVFDLNSDLKNNPERIIFNETYFYVKPNNPDEVFSIYGAENGVVLVDSYFVGTTAFDIGSLSVDVLIFIKKQIENYQNVKMIRERM